MQSTSNSTFLLVSLLYWSLSRGREAPRQYDFVPMKIRKKFGVGLHMPKIEHWQAQHKMVDESTKKTLSAIPLLRTKAGPRDKDEWVKRLKEEYQALIKYVQNNKEADNDWFRLESNKEGTRWFGKCWYIHELLKYEFDIEFDIPVTYPTTSPELALPELDGKTAKMYRGGKICLTDHFKPLWARNVPKFGIAHAMALGLGPWLAVEIPDLISRGIVVHQEKPSS